MLLAEKTREIGTAASYFIFFYLLLNFTSALLQAKKAFQKKKPNYICTGPKRKYRQKVLKFVGIAETSRYTPVFWAV